MPSADSDGVLAALDPEQRQVAQTLRGPVRVLAGAGTGKTRAITHRIAYGVLSGIYQPTHVLAVTFTARAAGEMRSRLRDLGVGGVQARTFHAAALRQLTYFWPQVVGGEPWRVVEHKVSLVAQAARSLGVTTDRLMLRDLASEIEWAKVSIIAADDYPAAVKRLGRTPPSGLDATTMARTFARYEQVKADQTLLDFEDVLLLTAQMLEDEPEVARQVRAQYRHFVVDEYQDVSALQQRLLDMWLGGRDELCVVGDPGQTIYSFAGADPRYLMNFTSRYPGAATVELVRDYRSTPQVVSLANSVLRSRVAQIPDERNPLTLQAQRPSGPPVAFTVYEDDEKEARGVVGAIQRWRDAGVDLADMAVLFRTNAQSAALEEALAAAGVSFQVRGGERFFQRRDVREAVVALRAARMTASPGRALPEVARDVLSQVGWAPQAPATAGAVRERWEATEALAQLADQVAARSSEATMSDLIAEIDDRIAHQNAPTVAGVSLASLHAAKGLEWRAVALVGVSEGLIPISLAETPEALAEERRLLYVGVTRAKEYLEVSYARGRAGGQRHNRKVSRFLAAVWPQPDPRSAPRNHHGRDGGRRAVILNGEGDQAVADALVAWRREVAEEAAKPAFTVLSNASIAAIAEILPATERELIAAPGIGPSKLDRWGRDILRIVAEHRS